MYQRASTEIMSISICTFFILMMLCPISHAGGFGRAGGDIPAPVRTEVTQEPAEVPKKEPTPVPAQPPIQSPVKKALLPDDTLRAPAIVKGDEWIDHPGNGYKLGAYILGLASLIPLGIGGYALGRLDHGDFRNNSCPGVNGPEAIGCSGMWAAIGAAYTGVICLGIGIPAALTAIGLFIAGEVKEREERTETLSRIRIEPYIDPLTKKDPAVPTGLSLDGAVVGLKGSF